MLPEKPWKTDAILRLFASVVVCMFLGSMLEPVIRYCTGPHPAVTAQFLAATIGGLLAFSAALVLLGDGWKLENFQRKFISVLACVYGGFVLAWWQSRQLGGTSPTGNMIWKVVLAVSCFQGASLLLMIRFLREHRLTWAEAFGFNREPVRAWWLGAFAAGAIILLVSAIQFSIQRVFRQFGIEPEEQTAVQVVRSATSWSTRIVLAIATILIAPLAEEILFRGTLYPALKRAGYPRLALWGTSLVFAAIHLNVVIFVPLTLLALILVWLYEKTSNLLAPIIAHSVFNAVNFLMIYGLPWFDQKLQSIPAHSGHS
jgi:membrane protease YdiL (CAAX protease family)